MMNKRLNYRIRLFTFYCPGLLNTLAFNQYSYLKAAFVHEPPLRVYQRYEHIEHAYMTVHDDIFLWSLATVNLIYIFIAGKIG